MCKKLICLFSFVLMLSMVSSVQALPFSIAPVEDIELGNDAYLGPDASKEGSGVNARELDIRRRVFLISYDISSLQGREGISQVSLGGSRSSIC